METPSLAIAIVTHQPTLILIWGKVLGSSCREAGKEVKTKQKTSSQFNRQHLGIIRKLSAKLADNLSFSLPLGDISMLTLKIVVNVDFICWSILLI